MKKISVKFIVFFACLVTCSSFGAELPKNIEKNSVNEQTCDKEIQHPFRGTTVHIIFSEELKQLAAKTSPVVVTKEMIEGTHRHHIKKSQKEPCGCSAFYRCFDYERD